MLATVTNTSGGTINNLITGGSGVSSDAVGGSKNVPLPYPFGHIGSLANGANKVLPVHPADWRTKSVPWLTFEPATEWNQLVQAGKVTMAFADQATVKDQEEAYFIQVG